MLYFMGYGAKQEVPKELGVFLLRDSKSLRARRGKGTKKSA